MVCNKPFLRGHKPIDAHIAGMVRNLAFYSNISLRRYDFDKCKTTCYF